MGVFASTNKDVDALNAELRQVRRDRGELVGQDVQLHTSVERRPSRARSEERERRGLPPEPEQDRERQRRERGLGLG